MGKGLEQVFLELEERSEKTTLTIQNALETLSGRGYPILLILLSIPFCQPIQIPGFSTPFGIIIAFIGLRVAFGHHIWLPESLLSKTISSSVVKKLVKYGLWLNRKVKRITKERMEYLCGSSFQVFNGVLLFLLGIFLALPLPIPLSNLMAAWAILLISFGLLERDGYFIIAGYVMAFICLIVILGIFFFIKGIFF